MVAKLSQDARGGALNRPMMEVLLSPTASGQDRLTTSGQDRPTASGQDKPRRDNRGIPWGVGEWQLAEIANADGEIIGCGATCKHHVDDAADTIA